ncbi:3-deoxy-D-manno-octulosonic acid transferase [Candidatus Pelagibacter sp. HIMB1495]|uniref:3-deoxy-D-manno-octulosonic acid transferase n=1 Tax=unclassified Candidatus Pelagibacter TaxID=2647897 RepID=UPI003F82607A
MFILYQVILSIIILISPIVIILRIYKNKEDKIRFVEKFSIPSEKRRNGLLVWFHACSVGEILSIVPLIKNYEKNNAVSQILVTSSTLSSSKVLKKFKFKKTIHQFYPIDHLILVNSFLNYWKPNIAVFVESEIWPCMFQNLKYKNIPLILLNARITKKTFNRWLKFKNFIKSILENIKIAYPQNKETKSYLKKLGLKNYSEIGNIKFAEYDDAKQNLDKKLNVELKNKKLWIASSTHNSEEIFCAKTHIILKRKYNDLITIIIPRHIHRVKEIASELGRLKLNVSLHSLKTKNLKNTDIYIVDTFGETKKFHKLGASVFLGGSIINRGGQNPLEAARYGAKILHGPFVSNFTDIYNLLKSNKISKKINTTKQLSKEITFNKNIQSGFKIKNIGEKILKKTIKELDKHIFNEFKKT